jgi:hypothetical protein
MNNLNAYMVEAAGVEPVTTLFVVGDLENRRHVWFV